MKKLFIGLGVLALVLSGCGTTARPADKSVSTPSQSNEDTTKNYERYDGPIWASEPVDCGGGIICLINKAQECSPSKSKFIAEYYDETKRAIRESYEIGIQGQQSGRCQMYFKIVDKSVNGKPEKLRSMPLQDASLPQYQVCRFDKASDIADILRQGPKDASSTFLGNGFLADNGMLNTLFDLNGTKEESKYVELAQRCFMHNVPDAARKITGVQYGLVAGEAVEDASQDFRLTLNSIDGEKSADFTLMKGDKREDLTLNGGEEKTVLGYKLKLDTADNGGFGQKNVAVSNKQGEEKMESAVFVKVGL